MALNPRAFLLIAIVAGFLACQVAAQDSLSAEASAYKRHGKYGHRKPGYQHHHEEPYHANEEPTAYNETGYTAEPPSGGNSSLQVDLQLDTMVKYSQGPQADRRRAQLAASAPAPPPTAAKDVLSPALSKNLDPKALPVAPPTAKFGNFSGTLSGDFTSYLYTDVFCGDNASNTLKPYTDIASFTWDGFRIFPTKTEWNGQPALKVGYMIGAIYDFEEAAKQCNKRFDEESILLIVGVLKEVIVNLKVPADPSLAQMQSYDKQMQSYYKQEDQPICGLAGLVDGVGIYVPLSVFNDAASLASVTKRVVSSRLAAGGFRHGNRTNTPTPGQDDFAYYGDLNFIIEFYAGTGNLSIPVGNRVSVSAPTISGSKSEAASTPLEAICQANSNSLPVLEYGKIKADLEQLSLTALEQKLGALETGIGLEAEFRRAGGDPAVLGRKL